MSRARNARVDSEKLEGIPHPFPRLMRYVVRHYPVRIGLTVACIIMAAVASAVGAIFMQRIIDTVVTPGLENGFDTVRATLVRLVITMGIIFCAGVIGSFISTRAMAIVTQGTLKHMRDDMFDSMERLPLRFFDTHPHGAIMSTFTNDTDAIRQLIGQSIPTLIQSGLTIVVLIGTMLYYSVWLALVVLLVGGLMVWLTGKLGGLSGRFMSAQQSALADEEGFIEEMMDGQKVVQVFNHEQDAKDDFIEYNQELFEVSEKANIYGNVLMPALGNIGNIMYVVVAVVGGVMILRQAPNLRLVGIDVVTVGIVVSFLGMVRNFSQTIGQMSMQVPMIALGLAGAGRVFALIDQEPEEDHGYVTLVRARERPDGVIEPTEERTGVWAWRHPHQAEGTVTYTRLRGELVMEGVDFSYDGEKEVLRDISLWAKPGQKIAFVGATGAGKTTITNLINRFYDIDDGKIRYDGINVNKIHKPDLRRSLGVVLQDVKLFTGTVMENIRYGRLDATDEECIEAAKLANADSFIRRLPDGYDTMLTGNGSNLSQGQAQLLSIARAAVADPPAMILDEATSSIDTRTESLVQQGMDNLMQGRTVFVIAHRLSTVRNSDAIMVMDHGRIIERGSHDDLIAQKGLYYQLYTGAFELE
ncbi:ABC transporter ATP-binding protein [Schaalia meyeri]|uniref:Fatty acid ABC transporter ATP-binding/permease protein n=1 Tax=Schaalia meyeri TaxID=52773 RepID=A0AAQ0BWA1_9ACTO|nr:ABC transporter ATP-binding protein [Schaalia meyeri]QQC44229.1 ABC transporter ATP-binding protein [Schaalia meyeri]SDR64511.1 ATP-binding cassette, subfamily B [Schaalia meyeri]